MRKHNVITQPILGAIVIAQSIIIVLLMVKVGTALEVAGWTSSVVIPLLTIAYTFMERYSLHFFLFAQKLKNWFGGRSATWYFALRLEGDFRENDLNALINHLVSLPKYTTSVKVSAPSNSGRFLMIRGGLNVELSLQQTGLETLASESRNYIYVAIQNLDSPPFKC
jgi:hypothetical protein